MERGDYASNLNSETEHSASVSTPNIHDAGARTAMDVRYRPGGVVIIGSQWEKSYEQ